MASCVHVDFDFDFDFDFVVLWFHWVPNKGWYFELCIGAWSLWVHVVCGFGLWVVGQAVFCVLLVLGC